MRLGKKQRYQILKQMCGVINEDDAIDPRHYFYNRKKSKNKYRKTYQLCRQVSDTLQLVLNGNDPILEDLHVVDVVPAPDSRRLLVIVGLAADIVESASHVEAIMDRLNDHVPRLRAEIASVITRRKTPQLLFEITTR